MKEKKTYWNKLLSCHKLKKIHFSCNTTSVHIWIRVWTEKPWNDAAHANRKLRHKYYTKFAIFHTWCNDSSLWSDSQNNGPVSSYIDKPHSSGKQLWFQIGSPAQQAFFLLTSRMAELGAVFGRSVNPISTKGGQSSLPHFCSPSQIFRPSAIPDTCSCMFLDPIFCSNLYFNCFIVLL